MLQVALKGQAQHASEPAKVLAGLNLALCGKFTQNFVTAAYLYMDLESHVLRYAGAGHPPVLQWRNSASKTGQILENGLVLGIVEEAAYETLELPLEPRDRYVLYTDGVVEAASSRGEQYGTERFMRFMDLNRALDTKSFAEASVAEIAKWTGQSAEQSQQDDITLLVIDYQNP
jgi:serine phosphatase RsbU (regulator of sigma subunit)